MAAVSAAETEKAGVTDSLSQAERDRIAVEVMGGVLIGPRLSGREVREWRFPGGSRIPHLSFTPDSPTPEGREQAHMVEQKMIADGWWMLTSRDSNRTRVSIGKRGRAFEGLGTEHNSSLCRAVLRALDG